MRPKDTQIQHTVSNTFLLIMSKSVMLSMLAQGNTGTEILSILDALTSDKVAEETDSTYLPILGQSIPTLEEIAF
jgi:hypothetical protein